MRILYGLFKRSTYYYKVPACQRASQNLIVTVSEKEKFTSPI